MYSRARPVSYTHLDVYKRQLSSNPADRIERPKKQKFVGSIYDEHELEKLFQIVRGDPIELGVILAAFYGLRRSEVVGLKWDAIDFKKKTITIRHTCLLYTSITTVWGIGYKWE